VVIEADTKLTKSEQTFGITLLTFSSSKAYDQVLSDFEKLLGKLDQDKAISSGSDLVKSVQGMEGKTGLMIIGVLNMDALLPALISSGTRARQYFVGNPLIASKMAQHNTLAALYAPPRVLIYTGVGKTWISYDQPSTCFGRLASDAILETAKDLDSKFENLVRTALT
jgi:uncharacterized protein (DUF302 family)